MKTLSENQEYSLSEAAEYLKANLSDTRSAKSWAKYLKDNPSKFLKQHGYRISCTVRDGDIFYSELALKAFIRLMGSSVARKDVNGCLREVDRKEMKKRKNFSKSPNWQYNKRNVCVV